MTRTADPKGNEIYSLTGNVMNFTAPNKDPGGPDGPTFIEFGMKSMYQGVVHNSAFYIQIGTERCRDDAANMAEAFAAGLPVTVTFQIAGNWDPQTDPNAIVLSVEL